MEKGYRASANALRFTLVDIVETHLHIAGQMGQARGLLTGRHHGERRIRAILLKSPSLVSVLAICGIIFVVQTVLSAFSAYDVALSDVYSSALRRTNPQHAPPIFVIAGGAPRTGSTFIFNVLRVLMRIRDPNTVASSNWMLAKLVPENATLSEFDRIALLRTLGASLLIKLHTAHQYYEFVGPTHSRRFADEVDLLVTSHRDLRHEAVSAFKMFAQNRSAFEYDTKWSNLCRSLIRKRESLMKEAGDIVPIIDIRYEDWRDGGDHALMHLIRELATHIPWTYTERDLRLTLTEVKRLRTPLGGVGDQRIDWHLSNLMSPRHISHETLSKGFIARGIRAVEQEPVCAHWLRTRKYI